MNSDINNLIQLVMLSVFLNVVTVATVQFPWVCAICWANTESVGLSPITKSGEKKRFFNITKLLMNLMNRITVFNT